MLLKINLLGHTRGKEGRRSEKDIFFHSPFLAAKKIGHDDKRPLSTGNITQIDLGSLDPCPRRGGHALLQVRGQPASRNPGKTRWLPTFYAKRMFRMLERLLYPHEAGALPQNRLKASSAKLALKAPTTFARSVDARKISTKSTTSPKNEGFSILKAGYHSFLLTGDLVSEWQADQLHDD